MKHTETLGVDTGAEGVIFLAQCLDEMLYEYTAANYKPRVVGLQALTIEAEAVIGRVEAGAMDRARLYPILDELRNRLHSDSVAKSLLSFQFDYYCSYLKEEPLKAISVRLGLLKNALGRGRYRKSLEHEIIRLCVKPTEKFLIIDSLRQWVSTVSRMGFSGRFLRSKVLTEFFEPTIKYRSAADLAIFFRIFDAEKSKFEIVFFASRIVDDLSSVMSRFSFFLVESSGPIFVADDGTEVILSENERVVKVSGVEARDIFSARTLAEHRLEHLSDMFALFHHKNRLSWRAEAVVKEDGGSSCVVQARPTSVKRSRDNLPRRASEKMAAKISDLSFSDRESVSRFVSVVRLHGAALEAASPQAQIVNLWTAMEVLVSRDSDSKLRGVKKCLMPFLVHGYFDRLLFGLAGDLYRWKRRAVSKLLKKVDLPGWSQHHKLALLLLGGDLEPERDSLYTLVSAYPLLRNRVFKISKTIAKPESLITVIDGHRERVYWQIERIYRARNFIVHDGSAPPHIDALAENSHEYLDAFVDRFMILCADYKVVSTLDEAISHQTKMYEDWISVLTSAKGKEITKENIRSLCALDSKASRD